MRSSIFTLTLVLVLAAAPAAEAKRIVGNKAGNYILATTSADLVLGRGGSDTISGRTGNDVIHGHAGDDILLGDPGRDELYGSGGDDTILGGSGADRISAGWGADVIDAGGGNDVVYVNENDGHVDTVDCGPGRDRAIARTGDRTFNCESVRRIRGQRPGGITWNGTSEDNVKSFPASGRDRHLMAGRGGNDELNAYAGNDVLWGNEGLDLLLGDHGGDWLIGGPGDDQLDGGNGRDRLWGGLGADILRGGDDGAAPFLVDELISVDADRARDTLVCGNGLNDRAVARYEDMIDPSCERKLRVGPKPSP